MKKKKENVDVVEEVEVTNDTPTMEQLLNEVELTEEDFLQTKAPRLDLDELHEAVETERSVFLKKTKRSNIINRIIFGVVLVLILGSLITAMVLTNYLPDQKWPRYLALGVGVGCLGGVLLYTFLAKRSINKKQVAYINTILTSYGAYLYREHGYSGYSFNAHDRFTLDTFIESQIYKDVKKITSRAIYNVKYEDTLFKVAEMMAEVPSTQRKRKTIAIFIGRYFTAKNNLNLKHPIYFYIKGRPDVVSYPTEIDTLKLLKQSERIDILGNPGDEQVIDKKLVELIRKIKVDEVLLDCTIAFHPGRTYVTVNYSNESVDFPYQQEFDNRYIIHYDEDNQIIREILDYANK